MQTIDNLTSFFKVIVLFCYVTSIFPAVYILSTEKHITDVHASKQR